MLVPLHTVPRARYLAAQGPALFRARVRAMASGKKRFAAAGDSGARGGTLSLLLSRLAQTKAAAASVPPGAVGPGGSMRAVPPLSAAILSICIWRAAINAPRGACSLPPPPDLLLSVDKLQNGLLLG